MNLDNAIYYSDAPEGRASFRQHLMDSILESNELRKHPAELKEKFLFMLSNTWSTKDLKIERDRKRSIEKVGTDAQRLRHAIRALQYKDQIALDYENEDSPLSKLSLLLTKLEEKSELLAKTFQGEHEEIRTIHLDLNAASIVNLLQMFEISCASRNDHPSLNEAAQQEEVLPPIHRNIAIGMRCVMLALLDAGEEKLSWTTTSTILKRGKKLRDQARITKIEEDIQCLYTRETKPLRLYLLEDPFWKHIKIDKQNQ